MEAQAKFNNFLIYMILWALNECEFFTYMNGF